MKIVIVEDEYNAREGIKRLIGRLDGHYEVVGEAENGLDGCNVIEQTRPDLVISDINMPYMNGIEMLKQTSKKEYWHKAIILTGVSEYEYARQALRLGVVDYLEKPITADDLTHALIKTEQELVLQNVSGLRSHATVDRAEQLIMQAVLREDVDLTTLSAHLKQSAGIRTEETIHVLQWYVGGNFVEKVLRLQQIRDAILECVERCLLLPMASDQSISLLFQSGGELSPLLHLLSGMLGETKGTVICYSPISGIAELRDGLAKLKRLRIWSLTGQQLAIVSEDSVGMLEVQSFHYPEQLDNRIRSAIADARTTDIQAGFTEWRKHCFGACHQPQQMIDATVRLICSAAKGVAEQHGDRVAFDKQGLWLKAVLEAQTKEELTSALDMTLEQILDMNKNALYSLSIMKALRLIHGKYQTGISLDEIADQLNLTPEYLSSLFNKELKQNYSSYIKQLRINKAKQLLLDTDMKAFEIAGSIGYPDAKYFSRVFKEFTGVSPGEYQRMHKR